MTEKLRNITSELINDIKELDIVLPELYSDMFVTKLKNHGIEIDSVISTELFKEKLDKLNELTLENIENVNKNIDKATKAINEKDEDELFNIQKEIMKIKEELEKVSNELYLDELTQIKNRKWVYTKFLNPDATFKSSGNLIFIDLNDFKQINDTYGHLCGDKTLKVFSVILSSLNNYIPIRYAGDEFILFSDTPDIYMHTKKMKELIEFLSKKEVKLKNDNKVKIKFSFGIAQYKEGDEFQKILDEADISMYKNKNQKN